MVGVLISRVQAGGGLCFRLGESGYFQFICLCFSAEFRDLWLCFSFGVFLGNAMRLGECKC